jgi:hypothetical protein
MIINASGKTYLTYLWDFTNFGVIYVFEPGPRQQWNADIMKFCIFDTLVHEATVSKTLNTDFSQQSLDHIFWVRHLGKDAGGLSKGQPGAISQLFLRKKELTKLMFPCIDALTHGIFGRSYRFLTTFNQPMDDMLAYEISNSCTEQNYYSPGIIEYAETLKITPAEAYKEIKLDFESSYAIKMRAYANVRYFQTQIRNIQTQEDSDRVKEEIIKKLIIDTML